MARFSKLFMVMSLFLSLVSACQNADNIGSLYGIWRLDSIITPQKTIYPTGLYLSFEGKVVEAKSVSQEAHGYVNLFGSLKIDDRSVTMQFIEIDETVASKQFLLGDSFHFPLTDSFTLFIRQTSSKELCLDADGVTWNLQKY